MFIIFGISKDKGIGKIIDGYKCKNCDCLSHVSIRNIQIFYVFFIPLFPVSYDYLLECTECKKTLRKNGMSKKLNKLVKSTVITPYTHIFSFLGPICALLVVLFALIL